MPTSVGPVHLMFAFRRIRLRAARRTSLLVALLPSRQALAALSALHELDRQLEINQPVRDALADKEFSPLRRRRGRSGAALSRAASEPSAGSPKAAPGG